MKNFGSNSGSKLDTKSRKGIKDKGSKSKGSKDRKDSKEAPV